MAVTTGVSEGFSDDRAEDAMVSVSEVSALESLVTTVGAGLEVEPGIALAGLCWIDGRAGGIDGSAELNLDLSWAVALLSVAADS